MKYRISIPIDSGGVFIQGNIWQDLLVAACDELKLNPIEIGKTIKYADGTHAIDIDLVVDVDSELEALKWGKQKLKEILDIFRGHPSLSQYRSEGYEPCEGRSGIRMTIMRD